MTDKKFKQIIVSIIMPCYNQGKYIMEAINSVKSQTFTEWECIIVDDGSTDDSYIIAEKNIKNDERFILIKQNNMGVCIARNNAVKKASGKYILPFDADDILSPLFLEKTVRILEENNDCKLVYTDFRFF